MSEKQVIVILEDGFGRVQTSIATSLSAPKLMDKIMEIDEQQDTIFREDCGAMGMSEKQFRLSSETVLQYKIMDNDTDLNESEVVDLLNKLYEENKQLKEQVQILKKEVRDLLHLCDVCDIQSHLSDECEEVLNDE